MLNYTYLATQADLVAFNANELANYRYVALFGLGRHAGTVHPNEFDLLCTGLACFMRHECLIVLDTHLKEAPEGSYVKSIYHIFDAPPQTEAFVAVATVSRGINDQLLLNPVYHELGWDAENSSRYPCFDALNHGLERIEALLAWSSLSQVPLPELPPASRGLVFPNGRRIASLIDEHHVTMEDVGGKRTKNGLPSIDRKSVSKAAKGEPVTKAVLEHIAEVFGEPCSSLAFDRIIPQQGRFRQVRLATERTKEELAKEFGLSSAFVFELLETATTIPADTMLFFHHHYKKLLGDKSLPFSSLVDLSRTEADSRQPDRLPVPAS